jgi:hypothetical protein
MCGFECTSWYGFLMWIANGDILIQCGCLKVVSIIVVRVHGPTVKFYCVEPVVD